MDPSTHRLSTVEPPIGSRFIGREGDITALRSLLGDSAIRLITITGPGGIGKTRLALETCVLLPDRFPDGVVVSSLVATTTPDLVPAVVAHALALEPSPDIVAGEAVRTAIDNAHMLLVLDNLEHLLGAGLWLSSLLQDCPNLTILVTSRSRLNLQAEHIYTLDGLPPKDARKLFRQRARMLRLGNDEPAPSAAENATIDAICARLDRIPLAIELAAARTVVLSPEAIRERLSSLSLLRSGPRDAPLRHKTMRDTIAWSYDLLDEDHRAAFRHLAIFVGGFTLEGAQAVLRDMDAFDLVGFLVTHSLVVPMTGGSASPRFTMLETIRQFGVEMLAARPDEDETVRLAHADWLIDFTEHATPYLDGPLLNRYLLALNDELDNFRAAIAWTIARQDGERACRLVGGTWRIWGAGESRWLGTRTLNDVRAEAIDWTKRALALSGSVPFVHVVEAMSGMGLLLDTAADPEGKRALMEDLLARSHAAGLPQGEYWARFALADIAQVTSDPEGAIREAQMAVDLAPSIRDPDNQRCGAELHLANILLLHGDLNEAETHYLLALEYGQRAGNPHHLALVATSLARTYLRLGKPRDVIVYALMALETLRSLRDAAHSSLPLLAFAEIAHARGFHPMSVQFLAHATSVPRFINASPIDEETIARFRQTLPESQFAAAWEAGMQASPDDMVELAREFAMVFAKRQAPLTDAPSLLSPREQEVVRLLVVGLTNRAIGQALFISDRTVEKHLLHIMTKLDLASRVDVVAWAIRSGFVV